MNLPDDFPFDIKIPADKKIKIKIPQWTVLLSSGLKVGKEVIHHLNFRGFKTTHNKVGDQTDHSDQKLVHDVLKQSQKACRDNDFIDLEEILNEYNSN
jgi:hypothetical protein